MMEAAVKSSLKDASKIAFWDDDGRIYYSNFQTNAEELRGLARVLGDRESAIKQGMVAGGVRYEVHRHHPPAVYGRTMDGAPESSEGAAVYKVEPGLCGRPCYGFISYKMPNLSARMVPMLQTFCHKHLVGENSVPVVPAA
ncbi:hypothetical protein CEUSTIGMA_g2681.t1 [Chlamydomonas eustigma]|uniref:Uncharacterized protein n=1 Tax=Chlamydomonas eustigma TaxID=1157962 RepID=A0A250WWT8_9CHLO|nr:hypothetical protein CEUSTIGMA_g2681.t1 [Chlamydomonas eustigma]|eukprot:GAX75236.1 hypothetical protein CEUSTIGMA_g2681.t1 [Chlamydomonas eustigma]